MQTDEKFAIIKRKTRQRLLFAVVTMTLYFSFALNYLEGSAALIASFGIGGVPGPLVMFVGLVLLFILLELIFLFLNRGQRAG
jgi:hypothetical protein